MKYKRRNYVVDRRLQFGMISLFLTAVLVALFVTTAGFVTYYWVRYSSSEAPAREYITVHSEVDGSYKAGAEGESVRTTRMDLVLPPLLINNFCIMVIIAVLGIFFSHRIAGPIYHIQRVIDQVLDGKKDTRVHLRPRDFGEDLADKVNALLDSCR